VPHFKSTITSANASGCALFAGALSSRHYSLEGKPGHEFLKMEFA
jgi:hypothetical protein